MATYKATETVTTRPSSTSLFTIDSEDRYNGDYTFSRGDRYSATAPNVSPYNFTLNKQESLMNGFFTRIAVTEVVMNWTVPNINKKSNAMIVKYTNATGDPLTATITIPIGFYTPSQLATAIQSAVRTTPGGDLTGFTMTYGAGNLPCFTYNAGASLSAAGVGFLPLDYNSVAYPYSSTTKQLFDVLGFTTINSAYTLSTSSGITSYAQWCRYVDIISPQMTYNQPLKDTSTQPVSRDALCRIYLDQVSGSFNANKVQAGDSTFTPTGTVPFVIYHDYAHPKQINWTPNQPVGQLTFQVYDDTGALLSDVVSTAPFGTGVATGGDWSMTLLVSEN